MLDPIPKNKSWAKTKKNGYVMIYYSPNVDMVILLSIWINFQVENLELRLIRGRYCIM